MTFSFTLQPWLLIPAAITVFIIWLVAHDETLDLWPAWLLLWFCTAGISLATGMWAQWGASS